MEWFRLWENFVENKSRHNSSYTVDFLFHVVNICLHLYYPALHGGNGRKVEKKGLLSLIVLRYLWPETPSTFLWSKAVTRTASHPWIYIGMDSTYFGTLAPRPVTTPPHVYGFSGVINCIAGKFHQESE